VTIAATVHGCEGRELPEPFRKDCREVGTRFIRDAYGYGHWTCPSHEGIVRAYYSHEGRNER